MRKRRIKLYGHLLYLCSVYVDTYKHCVIMMGYKSLGDTGMIKVYEVLPLLISFHDSPLALYFHSLFL